MIILSFLCVDFLPSLDLRFGPPQHSNIPRPPRCDHRRRQYRPIIVLKLDRLCRLGDLSFAPRKKFGRQI